MAHVGASYPAHICHQAITISSASPLCPQAISGLSAMPSKLEPAITRHSLSDGTAQVGVSLPVRAYLRRATFSMEWPLSRPTMCGRWVHTLTMRPLGTTRLRSAGAGAPGALSQVQTATYPAQRVGCQAIIGSSAWQPSPRTTSGPSAGTPASRWRNTGTDRVGTLFRRRMAQPVAAFSSRSPRSHLPMLWRLVSPTLAAMYHWLNGGTALHGALCLHRIQPRRITTC